MSLYYPVPLKRLLSTSQPLGSLHQGTKLRNTFEWKSIKNTWEIPIKIWNKNNKYKQNGQNWLNYGKNIKEQTLKTCRISQKIGPERLLSQSPTSGVRLIIVIVSSLSASRQINAYSSCVLILLPFTMPSTSALNIRGLNKRDGSENVTLKGHSLSFKRFRYLKNDK